MFSYLWIIIVVFIVLNKNISCNKCTSLQNITLKVKDSENKAFNITSFSGCIERIAFPNKTLTEVNIRQQNVTKIGEDTVRHMVKLNTLIFWGNPVATISEGAFRNLPRLKNLQISYGNVVRVPAKTFDYVHVPELQLLRLHNNEISSIADGAFSSMPKLKRIHMDSNRLTLWERSWFFNTTNIEIMDFQYNKIEIIPKQAFQGMSKLKQLFFDSNEIRSIEPLAFSGIKKLDYLGLRFNRLKELDERIFPNELSVVSLLIDANYLNYLPNEVLKKLSVKDLTIDGNPWKCPCLDRIHFWLYSTNGTLRTSSSCTGSEIPLCIYPESYSRTCLEYVDEQLTQTFINNLKNLKPPLSDSCARLD